MKPHTPLPWAAPVITPQSGTAYSTEPYVPWTNMFPRAVTGDKGRVVGIHQGDAEFMVQAANNYEMLVLFVKEACDTGVTRDRALSVLRVLGIEQETP